MISSLVARRVQKCDRDTVTPARNRVTPTGDIEAIPLRGAWTGNRGILHAGHEIVDFHGQQAAEKLLKAVLAAHGIDFPRTHSIRFLLDLLADQGLAPPSDLHGVTELYPFGVQLRCEAPLDEEPLDRPAVRETLERLRDWTATQIP